MQKTFSLLILLLSVASTMPAFARGPAGISAVWHDTTLSGNGRANAPLGVLAGGATPAVVALVNTRTTTAVATALAASAAASRQTTVQVASQISTAMTTAVRTTATDITATTFHGSGAELTGISAAKVNVGVVTAPGITQTFVTLSTPYPDAVYTAGITFTSETYQPWYVSGKATTGYTVTFQSNPTTCTFDGTAAR